MLTSSSLKAKTMFGSVFFLVIAATWAASAGTFRLLQPVESDILSYSTPSFSITFRMRPGDFGIGYEGISFTITNTSDHPIEIEWDRSSMTLPNGQTSNVIHEGTRYIASGTPTPPTTIPPGGRLSDSVIPTRNISYYEGWNVSTLGLSAGSQFGVYLALSEAGTQKGFNFVFEAVEVEFDSRRLGSILIAALVLVAALALVGAVLDL